MNDTISNRDKCSVCGKPRFEHKGHTLCKVSKETSMLRKIHNEIQASLAAARKTAEYEEEGRALGGQAMTDIEKINAKLDEMESQRWKWQPCKRQLIAALRLALTTRLMAASEGERLRALREIAETLEGKP